MTLIALIEHHIHKRKKRNAPRGKQMKYVQTSEKSVEKVVEDLATIVPKHKFGILHTHNLKETLNKKGVPFTSEVRVLEVCNPIHANAVLSQDISLNMVLPCRISVWQEDDTVKIGTIKPTALVTVLNDSPKLLPIAQEVENALISIIDEAK